ncbi:uncharacterized protein LOC133800676 [Humulus lupulus]|uniref:uncharacterized protein LOC133800676 n=1 Tax=Humulus lupulus TaxID=3486 RepID=UPI002B405F34|nr:uncharacterized protein LOC133800676 [Humulus lupulus]
MLDNSQFILHSSDSIAPTAVLHTLAFHLEHKKLHCSLPGSGETHEIYLENKGFVFEVEGDSSQVGDAAVQSAVEVLDSITIAENKLHILRTQKGDTFSICCWLEHSRKSSAGVQEELTAVLRKMELKLAEYGFGWENVLYIHLYITYMKEFATANETYVRFIKQEKCRFGVPSRSTIELPLLEVGLGNAYVEVLVANDHTKRVLHVQSISSWAPNCIGPYSQVQSCMIFVTELIIGISNVHYSCLVNYLILENFFSCSDFMFLFVDRQHCTRIYFIWPGN